jgi:hypothetical protein
MIEDIVNNFLEQGKVFESKTTTIREGFDTEIIKREQDRLNENKISYSAAVNERNNLQQKYTNLETDYSDSNNKLQDKTKMLINRTNPSNPYLNKNISLSGAAGTLPIAGMGFGGYVTSQGVFKSYPNQKTKDNIVGKQGCPVESVQGVQRNDFSSSLIQGSNMVSGQACGYEGQNVYVSSLIDKPTATYKGCYFNTDNNKNIAMETVNGITDFESCKTYAASNGYQLFGTTDLQSNGLSQCVVSNNSFDNIQKTYRDASKLVLSENLYTLPANNPQVTTSMKINDKGQLVMFNSLGVEVYNSGNIVNECVNSGKIQVTNASYDINNNNDSSTNVRSGFTNLFSIIEGFTNLKLNKPKEKSASNKTAADKAAADKAAADKAAADKAAAKAAADKAAADKAAAKAAADKAAADKAAASKAAADKAAADKAAASKVAADKAAADKAAAAKAAAAKAAADRAAADRAAAAKAAADKAAADKAAAERAAAAKAAADRAAAAKAEAEKMTADKAAKERAIAAERASVAAAASKAAADKAAASKAAADKAAADKAAANRAAVAKAAADRELAAKAAADRAATERAAAERLAKDRAAAERAAAERAAASKVVAERMTVERMTADRAAAERMTAERAAAERMAVIAKATAEKAAAAKAAAEAEKAADAKATALAKVTAERAESERKAAAKAASERAAADKVLAERVALAKAAAERAAAAKAAAERAAADKAAAERAAAAKAAADKAAAERAAAERAAAAKAAAEKAAAERAAAAAAAAKKAEEERIARYATATKKLSETCNNNIECSVTANDLFGLSNAFNFNASYKCGNQTFTNKTPLSGSQTMILNCKDYINNNCRFYLLLQDNGNVGIYKGSSPSANGKIAPENLVYELYRNNPNKVLFKNDDWRAEKGKKGLNYLTQNDTLFPGEWIGSPTGTIKLMMQADGKLVLYTSFIKNGCSVNNGVNYGSKNINAIYEINEYKNINRKDLGKVAYIDSDTNLREYPRTMLQNSNEYMVYNNYDSVGHDISNGIIPANNIDTCKTACNTKSECAGFVYNQNAGKCFLKNSGMYPSSNRTYLTSNRNVKMGVRIPKVNPDLIQTCNKKINNIDAVRYSAYKKGDAMNENVYCGITKEITQDVSVYNTVSNELGVVNDTITNQLDTLIQTTNIKPIEYNKQTVTGINSKNDNIITTLKIDDLKSIQENYDNMKEGFEPNLNDIESMLNDADITVLQENYSYITWSVLAVGLLSMTVSAVR